MYTIKKIDDKNYRISVDKQSIDLEMEDITSLLMIFTDENIFPHITDHTRATFDRRMREWYGNKEVAR